jgi:hypothetical protein
MLFLELLLALIHNVYWLSEIKQKKHTLLTNVGVLARLVVFWITGVPETDTNNYYA